jgi:endonuclease YncB( thermonuclease family)
MAEQRAPVPQHVHPAEVVRWIDGDSVILAVDQDYENTATKRHRLLWIDTPERKLGEAATNYVNRLCPPGTRVVVRSYKVKGDPDGFGRYLAEVFYGEININQTLLKLGLAVPYMEK